MKSKSTYVCNNCGGTSATWYGKCPHCGEWNSLVEEVRIEPARQKPVRTVGGTAYKINSMPLSKVSFSENERIKTGLAEFDRVLGGGIVPGAAALIGGAPGAGKSTLLLQVCANIADRLTVLYVTGEESARQIKLRADRIGVNSDNINIVTDADVDSIVALIESEKPGFVVIDSIQTMELASVSSSPGSVTQVRESTSALVNAAKSLEIPMFIIGHVNKDGAIAGPKVMEHIVDTVLYFENERYLTYRVLRCAKNRFGSVNEIGVFDMTASGLKAVENPSQILLDGRSNGTGGSVITCVLEGSRPILMEVQALVSKTAFGQARRTVNGFDYNRTNMLLAVLEKRAGFAMGALDVYINIVGGLMLDDPAGDLAIAVCIYSAISDKPLDNLLAFGEIGLGGEVRTVVNSERRIREAARLGFKRVLLPASSLKNADIKGLDIEVIPVNTVKEAIAKL